MTILKHEAKKIDNFSKVKFPISVFSVRLCNNCSIKEKYTLHLKKEKKKKKEGTGFSVLYQALEIMLVPDSVLSNGSDCK